MATTNHLFNPWLVIPLLQLDLRLGSSSYNEEKMEFSTTLLNYNATSQNTILDYKAGQSLLLNALSFLLHRIDLIV